MAGTWRGNDSVSSLPMSVFGNTLDFSPDRVYGGVFSEFEDLVQELVNAGQFDTAAKLMINMAATRVAVKNPFNDSEIWVRGVDNLSQVTAVKFLGEDVQEEVNSILETLNLLQNSSLNSEQWQKFSRNWREFNRQLTNASSSNKNTFMLDGELLAAQKPEAKCPSDKPPINLFGN